jgi:hypothetical protein
MRNTPPSQLPSVFAIPQHNLLSFSAPVNNTFKESLDRRLEDPFVQRLKPLSLAGRQPADLDSQVWCAAPSGAGEGKASIDRW